MDRLKRLLTPPLIVLAALLMWCEEWLWVRLKRFTGWVARFPLIHAYEALLLRLPPYPTMVVFLLPGTLLLPVKLVAVYWMTRGYWLASLMLIVAAKVLGTAIVARSYVVCYPKLMTIGWFRDVNNWLIATRNMLYAAIREMPLIRAATAWLKSFKSAVRRMLRRLRGRGRLWLHWRAILRWRRRTQNPISVEAVKPSAVERMKIPPGPGPHTPEPVE